LSLQHRVGFREAFEMAQLRNGPGDVDFFEIYCPYAVLVALDVKVILRFLTPPCIFH
jgi:hypothetical protein